MDGGRLALSGVGVALAVALPAALAAQVVDALHEGEGTPSGVLLLAPVVLAGALVGGLVVGHRRPARPWLLGGTAGAVAIALVQALGVARRLIADEGVTWSAVPVTVVLGGALGALGALLASRRAGRKRT